MSPPDQVDCTIHGPQGTTFVCQHIVWSLRSRIAVGFFSASSNEPRPDAWCAACQQARLAAGDEWTDDVMQSVGIQILCGACYDTAKAIWRRWRTRCVLASPPAFADLGWPDVVAAAGESLRARQHRLEAEYGIGRWERWDYDFDAATLTFSTAGRPGIVADIRVVGTTATSTGTWLWSWDNPWIPPEARRDVDLVYAYGEQRGFEKLTTATWSGDERDGWEMTAVAACLLEGEGAYRAPSACYELFVNRPGLSAPVPLGGPIE